LIRHGSGSLDGLEKSRHSGGNRSPGHLSIFENTEFRLSDEKEHFWTFYEAVNFDNFAKSRQDDGFVKSSRCKARKN